MKVRGLLEGLKHSRGTGPAKRCNKKVIWPDLANSKVNFRTSAKHILLKHGRKNG